jgi:hypothetical protein
MVSKAAGGPAEPAVTEADAEVAWSLGVRVRPRRPDGYLIRRGREGGPALEIPTAESH